MKRILLCMVLPASFCFFCKTPATPPEPPREEYYLNVDETMIAFDRLYGSRTFEVETNIEDISCKASASEWCEATFAAGTVTIKVTTNEAWSSRSTTVHIEGKGIGRSMSVSQDGKNRSIDKVEGDVLIPVVSSSVMPAAQSGEGIEKSHDGLLSTIYHSNWNVAVTPSAPVSLTYNFAGADRVDYIANTHPDVFCKLVPFWQLKLYMHDVSGKTDFYKDLCQLLRERAAPATGGRQQIAFVKAACDAAELDLSDFFEAWGFMIPVDIYLQDYSSSQFTVTQAMIDEVKAYIAGKGYPKPAHRFERIRDDNLADFK